jgi:2-C-methyl-D-erythritol 4-phosphate cytidylyltransferase/2-C-methyl-D-erythritol 2,4-cyclodiphosphate synthase
VIKLAADSGAAILAIPVQDSLKLVGPDEAVVRTVSRAGLWRAHTPQGFRREILAKALNLDLENPDEATDESVLVERLGRSVRVARGSARNLKITYPEDLAMAESLMGLSPALSLRVGQGFDFHRFDPQRPLWLGGLLIEDHPGLLGHSDADVLAHALIDALLGAVGLGDIGEMFPDSDERWRGASGAKLIGLAMGRVRRAGYALANVDLTLIGETPKISPYRKAMAAAMAAALGAPLGLVSLKATTTEGLGFVGRKEGLAAAAVVAVAKEPSLSPAAE